METAQKDKERYDKLFSENIISDMEHDSANLRYETALKAYESARANMDQMKEGYRKEDIRVAKAKLLEGEAILKQARSNLAKIDMTEKEVEAARARVQAAEAAFKLAETQLGYMELKAPFKGIITSRNIEPGEVVSLGQEVFSLADLSSIELKIYVDETEIGQGQARPGGRMLRWIHFLKRSLRERFPLSLLKVNSPQRSSRPIRNELSSCILSRS